MVSVRLGGVRHVDKAKSRESQRQYIAVKRAENPRVFSERCNEQRTRKREFFKQLKMGKSCSRCGYSDWRCLDFHHKDGTEKDDNIAKMILRNLGKERILKEIEKCEVLCANCHRILHWEERNGEIFKGNKGSMNHFSKLNEATVKKIRESEIGVRATARLYNISPATVSLIRQGKIWTHVG
jgi:hypothetical protein